MSESTAQCLRCGRTSEQVPLIRLEYRKQEYWICPQDLPILIHRPEQLPTIAGEWTKGHAAEE